jgi:hypothetical protein
MTGMIPHALTGNNVAARRADRNRPLPGAASDIRNNAERSDLASPASAWLSIDGSSPDCHPERY